MRDFVLSLICALTTVACLAFPPTAAADPHDEYSCVLALRAYDDEKEDTDAERLQTINEKPNALAAEAALDSMLLTFRGDLEPGEETEVDRLAALGAQNFAFGVASFDAGVEDQYDEEDGATKKVLDAMDYWGAEEFNLAYHLLITAAVQQQTAASKYDDARGLFDIAGGENWGEAYGIIDEALTADNCILCEEDPCECDD